MFLFAYNLQEPIPSGIFTFMILYFPPKLEKLKYKYYNIIVINMQNQPYHDT